MRIFFEFTRILKNSERCVGIPRTIRNIASNLHHRGNVKPTPVAYRGRVMYDASKIASGKDYVFLSDKVHALLKCALQSIRQWQDDANLTAELRRVPTYQKVFLALMLLLKRILVLCLKLCRGLHIRSTFAKLPVIDILPNDVFVWTETLCDPKGREFLQIVKAKGARLIVIVYDLFQITMPELLPGDIQQKEVPHMILNADGLMSISATVNDEVKQYLEKQSKHFTKLPWTDFFYLGSELDLIDKEMKARDSVRDVFASNKSVYITIGTISPHKNHAYAIDAFEQLWTEGVDVTLCIIGKIGWKCADLLERIRSHSEWEKRLFLFNDISDTELAYCYSHGRALVFPSLNEGFGLPLVESMQFKLPVLASDIPIFREIGRDFVAYFDLSDAISLAELVTEFENGGCLPTTKSANEWQWLSWKECTQQLVDKISLHEKAVNRWS